MQPSGESAVASAARPAHVPEELVYDFDVYFPPGWQEDYQGAWRQLHLAGAPDILWTPRNGGHWLLIRGHDIYFLYQDWQHLSTAHYAVPKQRLPLRVLPINVDPPEHAPYRAVIQAPLAPKEVERMKGFARALIRRRIEEIYERGRCDFVGEFSNQVPIALFLQMTQLPEEDGPMILAWAEMATHSADARDIARVFAKINEYMVDKIRERRAKPGNDRLSRIITARIGDRALTDAELAGLCVILLVGGLDTVGSMMGFIMHFLACHPEHRRRLAVDPGLMPNAVNEFLRRFGLTIPGRVVRQDFEYKGIQFKEGDMMMMPTMMHGLDEREFADPMRVDFNRREKPIYSTFGNGVHRCPGSNLARMEIRTLLEEWLQKIPEFSMPPGAKPQLKAGGAHGSIIHLPLIWQP